MLVRLCFTVFLAIGSLAAMAAPRITGFSPTFGEPGTVVTIFGTDLTFVEIVEFGADRARGTVLPATIRPNQLQVVVPRGAVTGNLYIATRNELQSDLSFGTFAVAPLITEIDPPKGNPGEEITINGLNFVDPVDPFKSPVVRFNGVLALGVPPPSASTQIRVRIPSGTTTGPITIATSAGTHTSEQNFFTLPQIRSISPSLAAVGDTVTLIGTSFLGITNVRFGFTRAAFQVIGPTNIQAIVPQNITASQVVVENPYFVSPGIGFNPSPKISRFNPPGGPPGRVVTIEGTSLADTKRVAFNGIVASTFTNISPSRLTAVVPPNCTVGAVTVVTGSGTNVSAIPFFVTPVVTLLTPGTGLPGTTVTVTGQNFTNVSAVTFNDEQAEFEVESLTRLRVVVPEAATNGPISVTSPGGTGKSPASFVVRGTGPEISEFTPLLGPAGTTVTVRGTGLDSVTNVLFNGVSTTFTLSNATVLLCKVPVGAASGPIEIRAPAGSGKSPTAFLVGDQADLRLVFRANPSPAWLENIIHVDAELANRGPLIATNVELRMEWTAGADFLNSDNSAGSITRNGRVLTTKLPALSVGSTLRVGMRLRAVSATTLKLTAAGTNSFPEAVTDNNAATLEVLINPTLPPLTLLSGFGNEYELSWPLTVSDIVLESTPPAGPRAWSPLGIEPAANGDLLSVSITNAPAGALFRLRRNPQ